VTRQCLRLQHFAWGVYISLMCLLPYFPSPSAWELCVDHAEAQRVRLRAELDPEVQP
jgi:hypothetical protein